MSDIAGLSTQDINILRQLGEWKLQAAACPENQEKIGAWLAHDAGLPHRRVMVLAEVGGLRGERVPVGPQDLLCQDPWARSVERALRVRRWEVEVMRDDHVVSPHIEYHPRMQRTDFGVPTGVHRENAADGLAFNYDPPLKNLDEADFARLRHRTWTWDRAAEEQERQRLEAVFQDLLVPRRRSHPWQFSIPITSTLLDLIGLEGFMAAIYENPEGLHRLMAFIRDDHLAYLDWAEGEGFLPLNNEADYVGAGSMGYTRDLPQKDFKGKVRPRDCWGGSESQESVGIGPGQYREFVFPYLKALMARWGKVYYGCCEPAHPILDCLAEVPNLARVSVSPWADEEKMGQFCRERGIAYSRKPSPNFFSTPTYDEGAVRAHLEKTVTAARGCRLEIIQRDVYVTNDEPERFVRWVEIVREAAAKFQP